jgi:hypothetical protein
VRFPKRKVKNTPLLKKKRRVIRNSLLVEYVWKMYCVVLKSSKYSVSDIEIGEVDLDCGLT